MAQELADLQSKLDCALRYATGGYRVFPCTEGGKEPIPGCKWQQEATTDARAIREWWHAFPEANIGVVAEGFLAVDVDTKNGKRGDLSLQAFMATGGHELPAGWKETQVRTPSGGWHLYLRDLLPSWTSQSNALGIDGVDLKGSGKGYVLGVGSTKDSKHYTGRIIPVAELPPVPQWLQKPLLPQRKPTLHVVKGGSVYSTLTRLLGKIDPSTLATRTGYAQAWRAKQPRLTLSLSGTSGVQKTPHATDRRTANTAGRPSQSKGRCLSVACTSWQASVAKRMRKA